MHIIAVVEDNTELLNDLVEFLTLRGFSVRGFENAESFFIAWQSAQFDLLLLDVVLPNMSGFDIAEFARSQNARVGIIMLTALDTDENQVQGLQAGADMYLSKRSSLEVIEAACHSVLRRLSDSDDEKDFSVAESVWTLCMLEWQLQMPNGVPIQLTSAEAFLLQALFENLGQPIPREALLHCLKKSETLANLRNLDNTVSRLRRKVQDASGLALPIRSGYGKGYTFVGRGVITTI